MRYLIDGYNLAHATGHLFGKVGPHGLEKSRAALLAFIAAGHGDQVSKVTIVFDARHPSRTTDPEQIIHGLTVRFAIREEADDLIERLLHSEHDPKHLTVVSSDHRLKTAAHRRGCAALTCGEYLDLLDRLREPVQVKSSEDSAKPEPGNPAEVAAWLDAFSAPPDGSRSPPRPRNQRNS